MLIPTKENIRKIFETHQNQCAFSSCTKKILDSDGHFNGNILFLESNKKAGPRFNPNLTNEQMIDYHNLILICYEHAFDVEWREKKYTLTKLRKEIFHDLQTLTKDEYDFPNEQMQQFLFHYIEHHDPDTNSHVNIRVTPSALTFGVPRYSVNVDDVYVNPTKQFVGGKFEIIDTAKKLNEYDRVVFYPKNKSYHEGVSADVALMSEVRMEGNIPEIPKGEYFISIRSAIDDSSRIEDDLSFTIM